MSKRSNSERLKEIFDNTIENGLAYEDNFNKIDYYSLFCKAASKDKLYKFMGNNLCMFNCKYDNKDSIMMIFYIAINTDETKAKNVNERIMEVIEEVENTFITLEVLKSNEIKEEKFIYILAIKTLN